MNTKKSATAPKFKIKDRVQWSSTGNGAESKKVGTVIARIPAGSTPDDLSLPQKIAKYLTGRHRRFAAGDRVKRNVDSYLVLVDAGATKWLYWPHVHHLAAA